MPRLKSMVGAAPCAEAEADADVEGWLGDGKERLNMDTRKDDHPAEAGDRGDAGDVGDVGVVVLRTKPFDDTDTAASLPWSWSWLWSWSWSWSWS
jgi:hypothetical protein